jgi:prevent-host-death family protein
MTVRTIATDDLRLNLRDILDEVNTGVEVVVERYRKPMAVVVNYAQWKAWKEAQKAELIAQAKQISADIHAGREETTSHEELMRLIEEKRSRASVHVES